MDADDRQSDHVMLQFAASNSGHDHHDPPSNNTARDQWGLESDVPSDAESIFSETTTEIDVWNYKESMSTSNRGDVLSTKLISKIEGLYYTREHLILYTVISLVKMLMILLYLSCLVMFFVVPSPNYWYLWTLMMDLFAGYVVMKASKQMKGRLNCRRCRRSSSNLDDHREDGDTVDIHETDGIFKHEWVVAMVNIVSVSSLLMVTTLIISKYMSDYDEFITERMVYLEVLAAIEIAWFGSQFVLWKLSFYGTIFYLLLLIPSILFGSAAFYALYEYYILSLVHTFLAVIFACGEFHLVGPHDDDTTLDPADWSVLGVLALLAKLFKFRMPQQ